MQMGGIVVSRVQSVTLSPGRSGPPLVSTPAPVVLVVGPLLGVETGSSVTRPLTTHDGPMPVTVTTYRRDPVEVLSESVRYGNKPKV